MINHFYKLLKGSINQVKVCPRCFGEVKAFPWVPTCPFPPLSNSLLGWKHGQRSWGHQGKSPFPRTTHDTCCFLCWFITLKFVFQVPSFTLHFRYKYILTTNWFYIMYIMHSCLLSHKHEQLLLKAHFQNP
jgi:hypothetical protein